MSTSTPFVKMKLAVHWPPAVMVWTPGWIAAVAAGAHAGAGLAGPTKTMSMRAADARAARMAVFTAYVSPRARQPKRASSGCDRGADELLHGGHLRAEHLVALG